MMENTSSSILIEANLAIPRSQLVPDEIAIICQWILYSVTCQLISLFGIGTNVINIICFLKLGFKDPVNVSLFGLAMADMGSLTTILWTNICINPTFNALDLPFEPTEFQYLISGIPHTTFTRISGWITALITMERAVCIASPLKAKSIVTSKRVSFTIVFIFIVLLAGVAPVYVVNRLGMKYYPHKNKTLLGLVFMDNREEVENVSYVINNVFIPFSAFVVISINTVILVTKLHRKANWRKTIAVTSNADRLSNRNQKVAKMVVMISTLFIVCFVPVCFTFLAMSLVPSLSFSGHNRNLLLLCGGVGLILETVNSSVNIFVYYHSSTNYRQTFRMLFNIRINEF